MTVSALIAFFAPWRDELLLAAMVASLADYTSTALMVQRAGPDIESNRVLRWIIIRAGMIGMWSFWLAWWTAIWLLDLGVLWASFFLTFNIATVINNIVVLKSLPDQEEQILQ